MRLLRALFAGCILFGTAAHAEVHKVQWKHKSDKIYYLDFEVSSSCARGLKDIRPADYRQNPENVYIDGDIIQVRDIRNGSKCKVVSSFYERDIASDIIRPLNVRAVKVDLIGVSSKSGDFQENVLTSAFSSSSGQAELLFNWDNNKDSFIVLVDYSNPAFYRNLEKKGFNGGRVLSSITTKKGRANN